MDLGACLPGHRLFTIRLVFLSFGRYYSSLSAGVGVRRKYRRVRWAGVDHLSLAVFQDMTHGTGFRVGRNAAPKCSF
jgi:hypothetical protein